MGRAHDTEDEGEDEAFARPQGHLPALRIATRRPGHRHHQSKAPGLGELLPRRTGEPMFLLYQGLGREEGAAAPAEGAEPAGLRLEQVE